MGPGRKLEFGSKIFHLSDELFVHFTDGFGIRNKVVLLSDSLVQRLDLELTFKMSP